MEEYLKRLGRFADVTIVEAAEEQAPETLSPAQQAQVKAREGERLARLLRDGQYVIALALDGRPFSSEEFAAHLAQLALTGHSDLAFLIGGSLGLAPTLLHRAHLRLSFGNLTFPHQLMRLMLLESRCIGRLRLCGGSLTINNGCRLISAVGCAVLVCKASHPNEASFFARPGWAQLIVPVEDDCLYSL